MKEYSKNDIIGLIFQKMENQSFILGEIMKYKFLFLLLLIALFSTAFSNRYLENFKSDNLHDTVLPTECIVKAELVQIVDAVFYTVSDSNNNKLTLKLAGINTECVSTAKFCLREAANHFAQSLFLFSDDEYVYYCKNEDNHALVWFKYNNDYYLFNLLLLVNDFAFLEGESVLFQPFFEKYNNNNEEDEKTTLKNKLGEID